MNTLRLIDICRITPVNIGLYANLSVIDGVTTYTWLWRDGSPHTWDNWALNEPLVVIASEHCAYIDYNRLAWYNLNCNTFAYYMCGVPSLRKSQSIEKLLYYYICWYMQYAKLPL